MSPVPTEADWCVFLSKDPKVLCILLCSRIGCLVFLLHSDETIHMEVDGIILKGKQLSFGNRVLSLSTSIEGESECTMVTGSALWRQLVRAWSNITSSFHQHHTHLIDITSWSLILDLPPCKKTYWFTVRGLRLVSSSFSLLKKARYFTNKRNTHGQGRPSALLRTIGPAIGFVPRMADSPPTSWS